MRNTYTFSLVLTLILAAAPSAALASHTVYDEGNDETPATILHVVMSNSPDVCLDVHTRNWRPNTHYMFLTLNRQVAASSAAFAGCYEVVSPRSRHPDLRCHSPIVGEMSGQQIVTDASGGVMRTSAETDALTEGYAQIRGLRAAAIADDVHSDGALTQASIMLDGFANVRVGGQFDTGGVIDATVCPGLGVAVDRALEEASPSLGSRTYQRIVSSQPVGASHPVEFIHSVSFSGENTISDNASTFFGNPPEWGTYQLTANQVISSFHGINGAYVTTYSLSTDGEVLSCEGGPELHLVRIRK